MKKPESGRKKLRTGSLIVILVMLFNAMGSLYFVMTAHPESGQFGISPHLFPIILFISLPILFIGIYLMIKGFRMEKKCYTEELKQTEQQIIELLYKSDKS